MTLRHPIPLEDNCYIKIDFPSSDIPLDSTKLTGFTVTDNSGYLIQSSLNGAYSVSTPQSIFINGCT